jgi:hypothetical protein
MKMKQSTKDKLALGGFVTLSLIMIAFVAVTF